MNYCMKSLLLLGLFPYTAISTFVTSLVTHQNHINITPFLGRRTKRKQINKHVHCGVGNFQRNMLTSDNEILITSTSNSAVYIVLTAIVLGVLTQSFINSMLTGDQGLSAFLSDGQGFNKSKFRPIRKQSTENNDPLPWLKLPKLDYVDVAGQNTDKEELDLLVRERLDSLLTKMKNEVNSGDKISASSTLKELKEMMEKYGFEYKEDVDANK